MSGFMQADADQAGWKFVNATPASVDQNSGRVTPPSYTAEKFLNDTTITQQADSPELLLSESNSSSSNPRARPLGLPSSGKQSRAHLRKSFRKRSIASQRMTAEKLTS